MRAPTRSLLARLVALGAMLFMALGPGMGSAAEIFKCTDDQGQIRFQETPCSFELSQKGIDEALAELETIARGRDEARFAEHVTRNALGGFSDSQGRTVLMLACSAGTRSMCEWALDAGEDPMRRDAEGRLAISHAARTGNIDNLELLLQRPADMGYRAVDRTGALQAAVAADQFDTALMLLEAGVDPNLYATGSPTALMIAVGAGNAEMVRLLVRSGSNPALPEGSTTAVQTARSTGNQEILASLNMGTRRIRAEGLPLAIPVPESGWDCQVYGPIVDKSIRQLLASDDSSAACFLESDTVSGLSDLVTDGLGVYRFSWIRPPTDEVRETFAETAAQYRKRFEQVFLDEEREIGVIQVVRRTSGGGATLISTCATVATELSDHIGVVHHCRYASTTDDNTRSVEAATRRWQDRISSLNR